MVNMDIHLKRYCSASFVTPASSPTLASSLGFAAELLQHINRAAICCVTLTRLASLKFSSNQQIPPTYTKCVQAILEKKACTHHHTNTVAWKLLKQAWRKIPRDTLQAMVKGHPEHSSEAYEWVMAVMLFRCLNRAFQQHACETSARNQQMEKYACCFHTS